MAGGMKRYLRTRHFEYQTGRFGLVRETHRAIEGGCVLVRITYLGRTSRAHRIVDLLRRAA